MATTQLSLYNGALRILKERKLVSLTENKEARRVLDDVWEDTIKTALEQGLWNFATRTAKFSAEVGFTPAFGYQNQFLQPSDFVRVVAICSDEYFTNPLNAYTEEAGSWFADESEIYVSYVSNHGDYGSNLSRWPQTFVKYVEQYLATEAGPRITGSDLDTAAEKKLKAVLNDARSKDAMGEPTRFLPPGRWTAARGNSGGGERGKRGTLIG